MSLDISLTSRKQIVCPHCGQVVGHIDLGVVESGGRAWYPFLESIGYYVPYDRRTKENDWYGKDRKLTEEEIGELELFAKATPLYEGDRIIELIRNADEIVVNADW